MIKVIYVEDSPLDAALLKAGLSVYEIEVTHIAQSDESLIEALSSSRYDEIDVIVLDVNIGELNGLQVSRRLRANGENRPILVISWGERPSNSELMAIQANFLPKPFDFERISQAIKLVAAHN